MADGFFSDEQDMLHYVDNCKDLLKEKKARKWVDPERWEVFEEKRGEILRDLDAILIFYAREGRFPERSFASIPIRKMRQLAKDTNDPMLSWWSWRTDNTPMRDSGGRPLGHGGDLLLESLMLPSYAVIKHTYRSKPEPVELRLTRAQQDDKSVYIGSATASELDAICKVPWMDPTLDSHEFGRSLSSASMNENEWQRVVDLGRVMNIASFISEPGNYIFNPVLIYINKNQPSGCFSEIKKLNRDGVVQVNFDFLQRTKAGWVDYFFKQGSTGDLRPATIIDGQHRIRGMVSSERGTSLNVPFVLIIGDGSKEDQRLIAEIFTQINTKSVPIDKLHQMYLSYKFGMKGGSNSEDWSVSDWSTIPAIPTEDSRPQRRAYELALFMASTENSPIYDMIQFQKPRVRAKAHICINATNWVSYVRKWFVESSTYNIYSDIRADSYFMQEFLNFFTAFEETCKSQWEEDAPRWKVGAGKDKPLLQTQGPFLSILELYPRLIQHIRDNEEIDEYSIESAITHDTFVEWLRPLSVVDWRSPSLLSSNLTGRNNSNLKHLVEWMFRAIENESVYTKAEVMDVNEESMIGKGLIAPPAKSKIENIGGSAWPGVLPLQLRCKHMALTQSSGWIVRIFTGSVSDEVDTKKLTQVIDDGEFGETQLTIESEIVPKGATGIEIQAYLSNANGSTRTEQMFLSKE